MGAAQFPLSVCHLSHVFSVPGLDLCRLHVTCCLSPATLFPQGSPCHLGMEMCCAVPSVLVTSYLAALGEVLGSLMDMWHPGVKENYHYKKIGSFHVYNSFLYLCVAAFHQALSKNKKLQFIIREGGETQREGEREGERERESNAGNPRLLKRRGKNQRKIAA